MNSSKTGNKVRAANSGSVYEIDFNKMIQINQITSFERSIQRKEISQKNVCHPQLPNSITDNNHASLVPLIKGQVIKVEATNTNKRWLFGRVLYDPDSLNPKEFKNVKCGWTLKEFTEPVEVGWILNILMKRLSQEDLNAIVPNT